MKCKLATGAGFCLPPSSAGNLGMEKDMETITYGLGLGLRQGNRKWHSEDTA